MYSLVYVKVARWASRSRIFRHTPKFYDQLPSGGRRGEKKKKKKIKGAEAGGGLKGSWFRPLAQDMERMGYHRLLM